MDEHADAHHDGPLPDIRFRPTGRLLVAVRHGRLVGHGVREVLGDELQQSDGYHQVHDRQKHAGETPLVAVPVDEPCATGEEQHQRRHEAEREQHVVVADPEHGPLVSGPDQEERHDRAVEAEPLEDADRPTQLGLGLFPCGWCGSGAGAGGGHLVTLLHFDG